MAQPFNLEWANGIRFSMVNDPGRQSFKEQIDMYGFRFLDDYLDNILSKPKQDSGLIDLVKTPSRKKAMSHKAKNNPSPSKLRNMITLDSEPTKENAVPLNSFHKALLKVKDEDQPSRPVPSPFQPTNGKSQRDAIPVDSIPMEPSAPVVVEPASNEPDPVQASGGPIELSMIMEDDESAEKSRRSLRISSNMVTDIKQSELSVRQLQPHPEPDLMDMDMTASSSADTFHSIPLASPHNSPPQRTLPSKPDCDTKPPPEPVAAPEPAPTEPEHQNALEIAVPDGDEEVKVSESIAPLYPTLPAPLPLRKSMKAPRDPSVGIPFSNPTPGPPLGKRTSWLAKARQVNALEHKPSEGLVAGRQTNTTSDTNTGPFGVPSTKRKSEDFFGPMASEMRQDDAERNSKAMKEKEADVAPLKAVIPTKEKDTPLEHDAAKENRVHDLDRSEQAQEQQQLGMLDHFKKTVEGLGAKFGKSMGKSMGGQAVANALAEARAAAEARVVERNNDEVTKAHGPAISASRAPTPPPKVDVKSSTPALPKTTEQGRLSLSDLAPSEKTKASKEVDSVFQFVPPGEKVKSSEPKDVPVFNNFFDKPTPVFIAPPAPPKPKTGPKPVPKATSPPPASVFSKPASMSVGLSPRLPSPKHGAPLTAQSTTESMRTDNSDRLFDSQDPPAWMSSTQDTDYDFDTQPQPQRPLEQLDEDDDSWPMEERPIGVTFTEGDSMTWSSSNPTQTHRLDTEYLGRVGQSEPPEDKDPPTSTIPGSFHMDVDDGDEDDDVLDAGPSKSTVSLVDPSKITRSETAMSSSSNSSSQSSNVGFFGQATKLVSSVLGSGKKTKPEVKSLQLAAAAAKKEQEEKEKKAAVMKNMENRRQQVLQKKAEEEKTRKQEEEKKLKDEADRRKREREDQTDKRPLKLNSSVRKDDEPANKARKLEIKKPVTKLPASSKTTFKPALKQTPASAVNPPPAASSSKTAPPSQKLKGKAPAKNTNLDDDVSQPSQLLQNQMAARAKAQLEAAQQSEPPIPSENIELPDINSEYSDSDDEDRVKTFNPPEWAQSPELRQALQNQSSINPDDIFGAIRPLRMEEIFRSRTSRFRARTSSANWSGNDRLTAEEEREYARRMGFR